MRRFLYLFLFLTTISGYAYSEDRRHPKLIAFFATWCVPCRAELTEIEKIYRRFSQTGLEVLLVSIDSPSSAKDVHSLLSSLGITAPYVIDEESELLMKYQPSGEVPFTVLLDETGRVVYARSGYQVGDEKNLIDAISGLFRETKPKEESHDMGRLSVQSIGLWRRTSFKRGDEPNLFGIVTRLEPSFSSGKHFGTVVVESGGLFHKGNIRGGIAKIKRALLDLDLGNWRIRMGDNYIRFGYGLSLSLRRIEALGTDTTIKGGRLDWEKGIFRTTVVGGIANPEDLDMVDMKVLGKVEDRIGGVEFEIKPARPLTLTYYGVIGNFLSASPDGRDITTILGGGAVSVDWSGWRISGEASGGRRTGYKKETETPWGATCSISKDFGRICLLAEGKWYRHWFFGRPDRFLLYHEPPNLERQDQQIPGNADSLGGRMRVDVRVFDWANLYINCMSYLYSQDGSDPIEGGRVWHIYGGGEIRILKDSHISISGGYRDENEKGGKDSVNLWHVETDLDFPVSSSLSITLGQSHVSETKVAFTENRFIRGMGKIGVAWVGKGSLSAIYGYSTEVPANPTNYPGAELKILLPNGGEMRLFGGRLFGGKVCVSGTCRNLPAFEGARFELRLRF